MALQVTGQAQGVLSQSQKSGIPGSVNTGWHNELLKSDLLPRYAYLVLNGLAFSVVANAVAAPAGAYPLGAAGVPLVAIYNPPGSGKNLIILQGSVSVRSGGTAGAGTFGWSGGPTAAITAAASAYLNLLSLAGTGSVAKPYSNTALTGSSALTAIRPMLAAGANTAATQGTANICTEDVAGLIVVTPGNVVALSGAVTNTAGVVDAGLLWAELPI